MRSRALAAAVIVGMLVSIDVASAVPEPPVHSERAGKVVLDVLGKGERNAFFDINPRSFPQIGQTISVQAPITVGSIQLDPLSVKVVRDPASYALLDAGQYDESWMTEYFPESKYVLPTTTTVEIWRSTSGEPIGNAFDLQTGFEKVYGGTSSRPIRLGSPLTLPLDVPVVLTPGRYVLSFGFDFANKMVMSVRMVGQQNGTYTLGGFNHDAPTTCRYRPTPDAYPEGSSYHLDSSGMTLSGPFPGTVGFGSRFTKAHTKVLDCVQSGVYDPNQMVWNPGDLDVRLLAPRRARSVSGPPQASVLRPTPIGAWDTRAALPPEAYSGLACDPFDPRLRNVKLPNGAGPEARVAAACVYLRYLENKATPAAPVTITNSPGFPTKLNRVARAAIEGGDRITGGFASPNRSYELVLANDEDWLCSRGAALTDPRAVGESRRLTSWAQTDQTGCPGTTYMSANWRGMNLGPDADIFFSWQLISSEEWADYSRMPVDQTPLSYFAFWSHEFQHQIQVNLSNGASLDGATGRYNDGPWGWYSEGQAEYIGFMTAEVIGERQDIRSFKLKQARDGLRRLGLASYDIASESPTAETMYHGGYLAYEYLVAHYGLEQTYRWWSDWNTEECGRRLGPPCWWTKAPELFGMSKDAMMATLNGYVARQVAGS